MAGKKDKAVVAVISGLTNNQAAQITKDILKSKQRNAPLGRGTVASGFMSSVGALLQKGTALCHKHHNDVHNGKIDILKI